MFYEINRKYNGESGKFFCEKHVEIHEIVIYEIFIAFMSLSFKKENTQININIKQPETAYIYLFDGVSSLEIEIKKTQLKNQINLD